MTQQTHKLWGQLMKGLAFVDLESLFQKRGIYIDQIMGHWCGPYGGNWEMGLMAFSRDEVIILEARTILRMKQMTYLKGLLDIFTEINPEQRYKKVYGAVAYLK